MQVVPFMYLLKCMCFVYPMFMQEPVPGGGYA